MGADLLYATEIWLLVASLMTWMFSRAALRLRESAPTIADLVLADGEHDELAALPSASLEDIWRAIRVYENR